MYLRREAKKIRRRAATSCRQRSRCRPREQDGSTGHRDTQQGQRTQGQPSPAPTLRCSPVRVSLPPVPPCPWQRLPLPLSLRSLRPRAAAIALTAPWDESCVLRYGLSLPTPDDNPGLVLPGYDYVLPTLFETTPFWSFLLLLVPPTLRKTVCQALIKRCSQQSPPRIPNDLMCVSLMGCTGSHPCSRAWHPPPPNTHHPHISVGTMQGPAVYNPYIHLP